MTNNDIDSRLICCVFQNMADEAIDILEAKVYSKSLLEDIGLLSKPFPLYWLVKCNEILLDDKNWGQRRSSVAEANHNIRLTRYVI